MTLLDVVSTLLEVEVFTLSDQTEIKTPDSGVHRADLSSLSQI